MASLTELVTHFLSESQETFRQLGSVGIFAMAGVAVLAQMAILPASPVAMAAGMTFGFWWGIVAITLGTNAGATINFLLARYIARGAISRQLKNHEKFRVIDAAVASEGWKIVALLRLCPLPFGVTNYCYGLTAIPFWPYFVATFFGIIPSNCFFVWLGASTHALTASHGSNLGQKVLLVVGLIAGYFALRYITRLAKAAVDKVGSPTPEPAKIP